MLSGFSGGSPTLNANVSIWSAFSPITWNWTKKSPLTWNFPSLLGTMSGLRMNSSKPSPQLVTWASPAGTIDMATSRATTPPTRRIGR